MTSRRDVTGMVTMAELLSLVNVYCYHWFNVRIYNVYIYIYIYVYTVVIQYVYNVILMMVQVRPPDT
jgi:hypothetical protein